MSSIDFDTIDYFRARELYQDPYPYYKVLREREPVHWSEKAQAWYNSAERKALAPQREKAFKVIRSFAVERPAN